MKGHYQMTTILDQEIDVLDDKYYNFDSYRLNYITSLMNTHDFNSNNIPFEKLLIKFKRVNQKYYNKIEVLDFSTIYGEFNQIPEYFSELTNLHTLHLNKLDSFNVSIPNLETLEIAAIFRCHRCWTL